MAKTKTSKRRTVKAKASAPIASVATATHHHHDGWAGCSDGLCFLCWIFKLMVIVFLTMLIFWLGFCLGGGAMDGHRGLMGKGEIKCSAGVCSPKTDMSHTMDQHSMDQMMVDMTAALKDKTGEAFDKEFLLQMIVHHEGAVEMAREVLAKSDNARLKDFAQQIIDAQSEEIDQMKAWQTMLPN